MRLDKFICHSTGLSRQQAQRLLRSGAVQVNDVSVLKADYKLAETDAVKLDNEVIVLPQPRYFMLHKPAGYVCANSDSAHPVVLDLINEPSKESLQIAGRLDIDTTGLVLITDDGAWNHQVTAPSSICYKTYSVRLAHALDVTAVAQLQKGVLLDGEKSPTQPAILAFMDDAIDRVRLSISEGKYHQVKRMFAAVGNHVVALHRESIGAIQLDPCLKPGQYRLLTLDEVTGVNA